VTKTLLGTGHCARGDGSRAEDRLLSIATVTQRLHSFRLKVVIGGLVIWGTGYLADVPLVIAFVILAAFTYFLIYITA
jgi:hypothetical protein